MLYVSTRGKTDLVSSAHAITRGLAGDGGLFVPQNIPAMRMVDIKAMEHKPYTERAIDVLLQYLTDFSEDELRECVNAAYAKDKFGDNPVPLVQVNENTGVLELWHGPTSAFKDMALQLLPHLLTRSMKKTGETNKVVILVATSGDTGKAALEGFADVEGTQIIVFYPSEGVSDIQKRQMITQAGKNVKVFGIEGNFDDAQRGVKEIFGNKAMSDELEKKGYTSPLQTLSTGVVWCRRLCIISAPMLMLSRQAKFLPVMRLTLLCRPATSAIFWPAIMLSSWACRLTACCARPTAIMC